MNAGSLVNIRPWYRDLVVVLGIPFDNVTMTEALERIEEFVRQGGSYLVVTANVHFVVQAGRDPEFMDVVRMADMITADGMPVVKASRWLGSPLKERVTGADMVPALARMAPERGWRLFLLGGQPGVAEVAAYNLRRDYPGLEVECYAPAFDPLLEMNFALIKSQVERFRPHIMFISLGAGKAEKFMRMYRDQLRVPVLMGVGAAVDFLAGRFPRAPLWMQRAGLEWVFRAMLEPRRLLGRYLGDFPRFTIPVLRQCFGLWRTRRQAIHSRDWAENMAPGCTQDSVCTITARGRIEGDRRKLVQGLVLEAFEAGKHVALDCSEVSFIDSSGLGMLVGLEKLARKADRLLVLVGTSRPMLDLLRLARLGDLLKTAASVRDARGLIAARSGPHPVIDRHGPSGPDGHGASLKGRIDADSAPGLSMILLRLLDDAPDAIRLDLDMSGVEFIDSSGVKEIITLHRQLEDRGRKLIITALSANVDRLFSIVRVNRYLNIGSARTGRKGPQTPGGG